MPRRLPLRRSRRRTGIPNRIPRRVRQAHRLLERGKHQQAALLFLELARRAEDVGFARAPLLYLQAGRALILANNISQGGEQIKNAFSLLSEQGQSARLASILDRTCAELSRLGYQELADELRQQETNMSDGKANPTGITKDKWQLPPKCSQCGATIHPDEVEIVADQSAACAYCGSRILAPGGSS